MVVLCQVLLYFSPRVNISLLKFTSDAAVLPHAVEQWDIVPSSNDDHGTRLASASLV